MIEKADCIICEIWRKAGTTLLCTKENCKNCGKDANGKLAFCFCRNCEHLPQGRMAELADSRDLKSLVLRDV